MGRWVRCPCKSESLYTDAVRQDGRLFDWRSDLPEQSRTRIDLQQGDEREAREAELAVKAGSGELLPPKNDPTHTSPVEVTVVRIDEIGGDDDPI